MDVIWNECLCTSGGKVVPTWIHMATNEQLLSGGQLATITFHLKSNQENEDLHIYQHDKYSFGKNCFQGEFLVFSLF